MKRTLLLVGALAAAVAGAPRAAAQPRIEQPIELEVGPGATGRGGILDQLLSIRNDDTEAVERGLAGALARKPWLRLVARSDEAAVVVRRAHRTMSSRSHSKDRKKTTTSYRYQVSADIGIRGDRAVLDAEASLSHTHVAGNSDVYPRESEDRSAFERAGRQLADKVRDWILTRVGVLRPDGPDVGFHHVKKFKLLLKGDGLEVTGVAAGGLADSAGLRVADRIRRIDGEGGTTEMDERVLTFRLEPPGTRVAIEVERDKRRQTMTIVLK